MESENTVTHEPAPSRALAIEGSGSPAQALSAATEGNPHGRDVLARVPRTGWDFNAQRLGGLLVVVALRNAKRNKTKPM